MVWKEHKPAYHDIAQTNIPVELPLECRILATDCHACKKILKKSRKQPIEDY